MKLRQPIVTIAGHVDHGKTSILDCFRNTAVQETEAGGITQKISFTKYPLSQIKCACPLIEKHKIALEIPGYLFIDTPGHAAFSNLRKRGGSLADIAILVVSIKEGIKPQTAEVLQILRANKTPFLVALNKLDTISGWRTQLNLSLQQSLENQSINAKQEFDELFYTFQAALQEHGFDSDLYFNIEDFTKKIALVPCSARTKEGIPELLLTLCGISQKYLKEKLIISDDAKGVILEIKKERSHEYAETILYDGTLEAGAEIAIATFDNIIISKIRAIEEVEPLAWKYHPVKKAVAATGLRLQLTNKEGILPGMPFQKINNNLQQIKETFRKELSQVIHLNKAGIIAKADSLGSLEALLTLLKQENISIVKAGIGKINKADIISAKTNLDIEPLNAVILGFNTSREEGLNAEGIQIIENDVVYKLIDNLKEWRARRNEEIERERLMSLSPICKLEILHDCIFRNSNPAVFGVRILAGKLRVGIKLINDKGEEIARVKSIQSEKEPVQEASEGAEVALSLPGINFDRKLADKKFLYSGITETQFKNFKKNKDLLTANELRAIDEIARIKSLGA